MDTVAVSYFEASDLSEVLDGVTVAARRGRREPGLTCWHGTGCPRGRGRAVEAPLRDHPMLGHLHGCGCRFELAGPAGTAGRVADHAALRHLYALAATGLGRLGRAAPGSLVQWDEVARVRAAVGAATTRATEAAADEVAAWAARTEARLAAAAAVDDQELHRDLSVQARRHTVPANVPDHAAEAWRAAAVAGRGGWLQRWSMHLAMEGTPRAEYPFGQVPEPVVPGRRGRAAWAATGWARAARWQWQLGRARRACAGPGWDATATVVLAGMDVGPAVWPRDPVVAAVGARWSATGCTLVVPASSAALVAEAVGGEVLGPGDALAAEVFTSLYQGGLAARPAWRAAVAATA